MRKKRYQILLLMCIWGNIILAADTLHLTLSKSIEIARNVSPDANSARHSFRSEYWSWRSFRADYLPQLSLSASPSYDRSINAVTLADGSVKYVEQNLLRTNATVTLSQNVNLTGGNLFAKTSLERLDQFNDDVAWRSVPVTIGYSQSLFGYNSLRWNKKQIGRAHV